MKLTITSLLLIVTSIVFGQSTFESAYVKNGRSFQFTVPEQFELMPFSDSEFTAYIEDMEMLEMGIFSDCLLFGNLLNEDQESLDQLMSDAEFDVLNDVEGAEIETYTNSNGQEFRIISGKVSFITDNPTDAFISITLFEEVIILSALFDLDETGNLDKALFKSILGSYNEYSTDRENAFSPEEDNQFLNNMFDTELSYEFMDFDPNYPDEEAPMSEKFYWDEDWSEEYQELLLAYTYYHASTENDDLCGVKVFSGGSSAKFSVNNDKLLALQQVFPSHYIEGISKEGDLTGDSYTFQKYTVNSSAYGLGSHELYITEIQGEMIFLLGYYNGEPTKDLQLELERLVKSLYYEEL